MYYLNADHWALAVPMARSHPALGSTLVNHNDFPREALLEAVLRMVEEDLAADSLNVDDPQDRLELGGVLIDRIGIVVCRDALAQGRPGLL